MKSNSCHKTGDLERDLGEYNSLPSEILPVLLLGLFSYEVKKQTLVIIQKISNDKATIYSYRTQKTQDNYSSTKPKGMEKDHNHYNQSHQNFKTL